jgi:hypothetical protein
MHSKIVPQQYYALVANVKRISKINWNEFTLRILLDSLRLVRKGKQLRQWPKGNLALLQVHLALIYLIFLNHCKIYHTYIANYNFVCLCSTCTGRRCNLRLVIALSIPTCPCNLSCRIGSKLQHQGEIGLIMITDVAVVT